MAELRNQDFILRPNEWQQNHEQYLLSFASTRIEDSELIRDLVQDTFLSAWKGRHNFRGECRERSWLTAILRNKIIDTYRRRSRDPIVFERGGDADAPSWISTFETFAANDSPAATCNHRETLRLLEQILERMPQKMSSAFRLREIDGCSTQEISALLEISDGNLWVLIHRARHHIQARLAHYSVAPT